MRIYTMVQYKWDGSQYQIDKSHYFEYTGEIAKCCGATGAQTSLLNSQTAFYNTLQGQLSTVFGNGSAVFGDLINTYAPIFKAGPSQEGFSAAELSNLNSSAITQVGQNYKNASEALGENIAAAGGGNLALPSGASIGPKVALAESAANQTSAEESQITQANYATGRQNWLSAASGLAGATNVFNPSVGFAGAANSAGASASNTANTIAQENNGWINAAIGALGGVAGAAVGGFSDGSDGGGSGITSSDAEAQGAYGAGETSGSEYL